MIIRDFESQVYEVDQLYTLESTPTQSAMLFSVDCDEC